MEGTEPVKDWKSERYVGGCADISARLNIQEVYSDSED